MRKNVRLDKPFFIIPAVAGIMKKINFLLKVFFIFPTLPLGGKRQKKV